MMDFDFKLEDFEKRLRGGLGDGWREVILLAQELIKLKKEIKQIKRVTRKVDNDD